MESRSTSAERVPAPEARARTLSATAMGGLGRNVTPWMPAMGRTRIGLAGEVLGRKALRNCATGEATGIAEAVSGC